MSRSVLRTLALGLALPLAAAAAEEPAAPDRGDLQAEVARLRAELEKLQARQAELEKKAAEASDRLDEAEVKAKDAVVAGDVPGSFRVPGTEVSLRLYGFAELNWVHEFRGDASDVDYSTFAPYVPLDGSAEAERKHRDYLTARTSRLGLEAATPTRFGPLQAKIEGDFNNEPRLGNASLYGSQGNVYTQQQTNSYGFRVRHAYGQFAGLTAGQTWSTFMDVDNSPETLDYNGPIGATFIRQPLIRYAYATPAWGTFTIALENSSSYVLNSAEGVAPGSLARVPDVVVRWDKGFAWGAVSVRAVTDEIRVDGAVDGTTVATDGVRGFGVASTAFVKLRENNDYLSVGVTYGDGIGRYLNYVEGAFFDPTRGKLYVEQAVGVVAGYQLRPAPWVRVNAVFGMTRNFDNDYTEAVRRNGIDGSTPGDRYGINRAVYQAHLGPIFTPIKGVDLGLEGIYGRRETLGGQAGELLRLNARFTYYLN